jgi:hypothetical protein
MIVARMQAAFSSSPLETREPLVWAEYPDHCSVRLGQAPWVHGPYIESEELHK